MEEHLGNLVVQPYGRGMCRKWAEVSDGARRRGRPVGVADAGITATALPHEMPLITHNREHFSEIEGLQVLSEAPRDPSTRSGRQDAFEVSRPFRSGASGAVDRRRSTSSDVRP